MTLQRPELLLLGPAAALLLTLAIVTQWRRLVRLGRAYGATAQLRLVPRHLHRFPALRMFCLLGASFALAAAAAGPHPPPPEEPEPVQPIDIAMAVDVSLSMGVSDLETTRIERAHEVVERLAEGLPSARIVLVLFADWPYTLVPPTDDPAVVRYFAHSLGADLVLDRDQGTSIASALAHARASLDARPRAEARRAVLVLSDGDAHEPLSGVVDAARASFEAGTPIWAAGLGTTEGGTVPTSSGPLTQDGRPVVAALREDFLREIAGAGGGEYHDVSDDGGLDDLLGGLGALRGETTGGERRGPDAAFWLTLVSIPALLVEGALDAGRRRARTHRPPVAA